MSQSADWADDGQHRPETLIENGRVDWIDDGCRVAIEDTDDLSDAVIVAVNKCLQRDGRATSLLEQTPLYERIDPDALNNLFSHNERTTGQVTFTYESYRVTVTSDHEVFVGDHYLAD